ncbi:MULTISPECIES: methyl-accepting chemotaxis protein [unclassified Janthinobacterium]|uniref:methyl-accepting chemotaxis protein n=1 Tax=unclassified Janthinobacterium TaxID=2610881 RepID=UPI0018C940A6|nr:methyl-accepting chemotaxis protein [Janthinobacterium sp. CG_23.4]MDH6157902.1 methyl-accepting chemotaxis protein [Janthinobacterium sp. CG_23.4]
MALSNLKIGTRLYLAFGVVVALLAILVASAQANFSRLDDANGLNIHTYEVMREADALLVSLINIETGERGFALTGKDSSLEPLASGQRDFAEHLQKIRALTADNPAQLDRLKTLEGAQKQWLATAIEPVIGLRRAAVVDGSLDAVVAAEQAGKGKAAMDTMRIVLADIGKTESMLLAQRALDVAALKLRTTLVLLGGGATAALLACILAILLTRNITGPLAEAVALAQRVAQGDLSSDIVVRSHDETGQLMVALRDMNTALVSIVGEVREGTDTIATASAQIAVGTMDLSSRTEQQASSLEETASSMEELTAAVKQNADNALAARSLASAASAVAVKGGAVVSEVVQTMGSINDSSRKIADIIGVIDGIAFQTNILALNAAVEAARAGEQGRGFAVVATEVRNLAQRSASAAKEIKSLIDDSVDKVGAGSKLVDQAGATMQDVVDSVQRLSAIIGDITDASEEQRLGIEQVNEAISQMDQVTQQNAALVEEAAAAATAMQDQAAQLSHAVQVFRLTDAQQSAQAGVARPAGDRPRALSLRA